MTIPKVRVRTRRPKTTSGCRTCRIRRIKCDESRPDCYRCSSTGRSCEWFEPVAAVNDAQSSDCTRASFEARCVPLILRPWYMPLSSLTTLEGQAFTFFRHHTAGQLHGTFQSRLWTSWTLQLSHREPAVMHAIIAVGSLHDARSGREHSMTVAYDTQSKHSFAMRQYCKAISHLQLNLQRQDRNVDVDVTLLVCLLFVGFELLRAEVGVAMEHLNSGLNIAMERFGGAVKAYAGQRTDLKPSTLIDELVPAFARLDYASTMFGQRYPKLDLSVDHLDIGCALQIPAQFQSVEQAKSYLSLLGSAVFRLRGDLLELAEVAVVYPPDICRHPIYKECYLNTFCKLCRLGLHENEIISRKMYLEQKLAEFRRAFEDFIRTHGKACDRSSMAIQIEYAQLLILVTHCRDTCESLYDQHIEIFRETINLATRYMESAPRSSNSQPKRAFALEPGILPTVFLVAEKCRDPEIRQRAIDLMRQGCAHEAMWDGRPYATFMQRLANIEGCRPLTDARRDGVDGSGKATAHDTILETNRYCSVAFIGDVHSKDAPKLVCARHRHESDGLIEITEHEVNLDADATYLHAICYG